MLTLVKLTDLQFHVDKHARSRLSEGEYSGTYWGPNCKFSAARTCPPSLLEGGHVFERPESWSRRS